MKAWLWRLLGVKRKRHDAVLAWQTVARIWEDHANAWEHRVRVLDAANEKLAVENAHLHVRMQDLERSKGAQVTGLSMRLEIAEACLRASGQWPIYESLLQEAAADEDGPGRSLLEGGTRTFMEVKGWIERNRK